MDLATRTHTAHADAWEAQARLREPWGGAARRGAELAHLHPDSDEAARIYARLGFAETPGMEIHVDL